MMALFQNYHNLQRLMGRVQIKFDSDVQKFAFLTSAAKKCNFELCQEFMNQSTLSINRNNFVFLWVVVLGQLLSFGISIWKVVQVHFML